ncbi:DUF4836 family protein [Niastella vici]|nr:DUF4836 family protein [Niastella vici]
MQRNLIILLLLSVIITGIVSCSHDNKGMAVPNDASVAVLINTKTLTSKVSWQEIQQNEWFRNLYSRQNDSLGKQILDDPANSGIDITGDLAFFIKKEGRGGYMAFEGGVQNATAFEAFATKINKGGRVSKDGDVNILNTSHRSLVAWTNNRFIYIMDVPSPPIRPTDPIEGSSFTTDSLQKFAVELFDLPRKNNLLNDDRFVSLMKETGDIHYWVNAEQYYGSLSGYLSLISGLSVLFEGNAYGTAINFENGKIAFKSRAFYNTKLKEMLKQYAEGKVSETTINRIPSKNVVAVFAMKYPPAALKDLIKLAGVDGFVNGFLGREGSSIDEFVKANKGDVLLSVSDFEIKPQELTITDEDGNQQTIKQDDMPSANVLFATSVNDKPAFDKLINILQSRVQDFGPLASNVHFQLSNDWFAASNSPEQVNAFLKGGGTNQFPFASRISGHAFGGYINLQEVLKRVGPAFSDSNTKAALDASINMWQDIFMTSTGEKDDSYTGEAEINLVDKNTNSLKQLNKYLDAIQKIVHPINNQYNVRVPFSDPVTANLAALETVLHP